MDAVRIGLIGFGTIGTGVAKILQKDAALIARKVGAPVVLQRVADPRFCDKPGVDSAAFTVHDDGGQVAAADDVDVVVELIGGVHPAKEFIETALRAGKHVVTANKELMAKHGKHLLDTARSCGVNLFFEASVGGGIPIIHALTDSLAANRIDAVYGILNGTTNYILTKMAADGVDYPDVLAEAQQLGYAEADPTSDVEGHDIAYKLCILAAIAFDTYFDIDAVFREGISRLSQADLRIAKEYGYAIKMLAIGRRHDDGRMELRVHPAMIPSDHPLASVNGSFNAVYVEGNNVDEAMFYGRGAGELPTASAVVGDIVAIARQRDAGRTSPSLSFGDQQHALMPIGEVVSQFYLRLVVEDKPGVLARISTACGDNQVSIRLVRQGVMDSGDAQLDIMTHQVREDQMQRALKAIGALSVVRRIDSVLRVALTD